MKRKKRTDKDRLSWMEKHEAEISRDDNSKAERFLASPIYGSYELWNWGWKPTIRQAIDAAMDVADKARS